ncbi:MAG: EVE domain-containing protein [Candidatus Melainabacteria bacterium]|nr:EVE domain-containing protein [Candidatus Melainabacteria bacterium]MBI3308999.1 EVE domain-containing protein [Candidatus Melainabacteria bacterium]
MQYWLVKTEPEEYSFDDLVSDGEAMWDGIRNYQARNYLKLMKKNDKVFVYHTGDNKEIIGLAEVLKEHYLDPKDKTGTWVVVNLKPINKLNKSVRLDQIKFLPKLSKLPLLKQSRLSVMPISKNEYDEILKISK